MEAAELVEEKKVHVVKRVLSGAAGFFVLLYQLVVSGSIWLRYEIAYWFRLFLYTSRQFLRLEAYLSIVGAVLFFGYILMQNLAVNQPVMLDYAYIYFTVVMVLLSMNLLPRERDQGTLEILWSQPIRRSSLIVLQLITLSIWIFILGLLVILFLNYFTAYSEHSWQLLLFVCTTSMAVGAFTVMVSTFCRHAIATGLVSLLVLGVHYFWIRNIGPLNMYYNPIPVPHASRYHMPTMFDLYFNRIIMFVVVGFMMDYTFRRLRRTAEWFT